MKRVLTSIVLAAVLASGCAGESADVSAAAAASLEPRVAEIRQLAGKRQADEVAAKLAELRSVVAALVERGELSDRAAKEILAAAAGVEGQLALITTTTTTTPPPPKDEDNDEEEDEDKEEREEEEDD